MCGEPTPIDYQRLAAELAVYALGWSRISRASAAAGVTVWCRRASQLHPELVMAGRVGRLIRGDGQPDDPCEHSGSILVQLTHLNSSRNSVLRCVVNVKGALPQ